mmetsp:Transcript_31245/g.71339  ORF Transcript_31245/g.71339 Transcript_31245/m.71339 type:complete len:265 (+) Transcript_31245:473-1267(+)
MSSRFLVSSRRYSGGAVSAELSTPSRMDLAVADPSCCTTKRIGKLMASHTAPRAERARMSVMPRSFISAAVVVPRLLGHSRRKESISSCDKASSRNTLTFSTSWAGSWFRIHRSGAKVDSVSSTVKFKVLARNKNLALTLPRPQGMPKKSLRAAGMGNCSLHLSYALSTTAFSSALASETSDSKPSATARRLVGRACLWVATPLLVPCISCSLAATKEVQCSTSCQAASTSATTNAVVIADIVVDLRALVAIPSAVRSLCTTNT